MDTETHLYVLTRPTPFGPMVYVFKAPREIAAPVVQVLGAVADHDRSQPQPSTPDDARRALYLANVLDALVELGDQWHDGVRLGDPLWTWTPMSLGVMHVLKAFPGGHCKYWQRLGEPLPTTLECNSVTIAPGELVLNLAPVDGAPPAAETRAPTVPLSVDALRCAEGDTRLDAFEETSVAYEIREVVVILVTHIKTYHPLFLKFERGECDGFDCDIVALDEAPRDEDDPTYFIQGFRRTFGANGPIDGPVLKLAKFLTDLRASREPLAVPYFRACVVHALTNMGDLNVHVSISPSAAQGNWMTIPVTHWPAGKETGEVTHVRCNYATTMGVRRVRPIPRYPYMSYRDRLIECLPETTSGKNERIHAITAQDVAEALIADLRNRHPHMAALERGERDAIHCDFVALDETLSRRDYPTYVLDTKLKRGWEGVADLLSDRCVKLAEFLSPLLTAGMRDGPLRYFKLAVTRALGDPNKWRIDVERTPTTERNGKKVAFVTHWPANDQNHGGPYHMLCDRAVTLSIHRVDPAPSDADIRARLVAFVTTPLAQKIHLVATEIMRGLHTGHPRYDKFIAGECDTLECDFVDHVGTCEGVHEPRCMVALNGTYKIHVPSFLRELYEQHDPNSVAMCYFYDVLDTIGDGMNRFRYELARMRLESYPILFVSSREGRRFASPRNWPTTLRPGRTDPMPCVGAVTLVISKNPQAAGKTHHARFLEALAREKKQ